MNDFIIQIEDHNGNELMSFRIRGRECLLPLWLRDLDNCNVVDKYNNEDGDTIFIIQLKTL